MRAALDKKRFGPWALVTGASSGIGEEFARQIAASGIHVALVGRREPLLRTVGAECTRASGVQHRIIPLDLSEPDFLPVLADATRDLDIGLVVSNAGTGNPGEFLKLDRQLLQETLRLSTMAPQRSAQKPLQNRSRPAERRGRAPQVPRHAGRHGSRGEERARRRQDRGTDAEGENPCALGGLGKGLHQAGLVHRRDRGGSGEEVAGAHSHRSVTITALIGAQLHIKKNSSDPE
jgi:NAD(P)-dependent dehydrogenase (short-subunit alcohol dehydrogenase family)